MKKIALLVNSLAMGGAEKVVLTLAQEFSKDYEIVLITMEKTIEYSYNGSLPIVKLSNKKGDEPRVFKLIQLISLALRLKKNINKNKISLVQSHMVRANFVNILARIFGAKHKIQICIHTLLKSYFDGNIVGKVNLKLINYFYPKADMIFANSQEVKEQLDPILNGKESIVIHNPFNIDEISKETKSIISSTEFVFNQNKKYIIAVGRLIKLKRYDNLIMAFSILSKKITNTELIIIGNGPEKQNLVELAMSEGVNNRVSFLGKVMNPFKFLAQADVFVSSSKLESFGNVIVEAMACECPVVSTRCPGGPLEILNPDGSIVSKNSIEMGHYGILVPVDKIQMLAEAILLLLSDDKLKEKYIVLGKSRAYDFNSQLIASKYLSYMSRELNDFTQDV